MVGAQEVQVGDDANVSAESRYLQPGVSGDHMYKSRSPRLPLDMEDFGRLSLACGSKKTLLEQRVVQENVDCNDCALKDSYGQSFQAAKENVVEQVSSRITRSEKTTKDRDVSILREGFLYPGPKARKPAAKKIIPTTPSTCLRRGTEIIAARSRGAWFR